MLLWGRSLACVYSKGNPRPSVPSTSALGEDWPTGCTCPAEGGGLEILNWFEVKMSKCIFLQDDLHTFGHFQTMYRMEEISKILMNSSDD